MLAHELDAPERTSVTGVPADVIPPWFKMLRK
jgi:hypothetical protein